MSSQIKVKKKLRKCWEVFVTGEKSVLLGLKISMQVLRPSDESSVGSYCAARGVVLGAGCMLLQKYFNPITRSVCSMVHMWGVQPSQKWLRMREPTFEESVLSQIDAFPLLALFKLLPPQHSYKF